MSDLSAAFGRVDELVDRFLEGRHLPSVAYGIVVDGELAHSRGIGALRLGDPMIPDAESVYRIASMTKSFTAATVLALRDDGRLGLDDPIASWVPELDALEGPTRDSPPITIRHLLTMSSGLATDDPWGDRQQGLPLDAFSRLLGGPLTFAWPPGTAFEYSNLGYGILGRVITNAAGSEYRDVVAARLLGPLGMADSTFTVADVPADRLAHGYVWRDDRFIEEPIDGYGALASMGGLFSTVRDLGRWVAFLAAAFPARDAAEGGAPLTRASRREMQQAHRAMPTVVELPGPDQDPSVTTLGYGFGLMVAEDSRWGRIITHSGGYPGFGSNMRWHPASGLGVVVLSNHRYAPSTPLARDVLGSLIEAQVAATRRIEPAPAMRIALTDAERLLERWDQPLAEQVLAMNAELDLPLADRAAALDAIRGSHGRLRPDPDLEAESDTPLHRAWWLVGARGRRVRVEIRLSPEFPPRIQTFNVTAIPDPSPVLQRVAAAVVTALGSPEPRLAPDVRLAPTVDGDALTRQLRVAAARFGAPPIGAVVGGDGRTTATWRMGSGREALELVVGLDADERVRTLALRRRPPRPPLTPPEHPA